jgi:hypothetical protein
MWTIQGLSEGNNTIITPNIVNFIHKKLLSLIYSFAAAKKGAKKIAAPFRPKLHLLL